MMSGNRDRFIWWLDDTLATCSMPLLASHGLDHDRFSDAELLCVIEQLWAMREDLA